MKTIRKRSTKKEEEGKKEEEEVLTGALLSHVENTGGIEYLSALSQLPDLAMKNKKEKIRESPPICQLLPFFFRSSLFASVRPSRRATVAGVRKKSCLAMPCTFALKRDNTEVFSGVRRTTV